MTLAIDASTPALVHATNGTGSASLTTASFTPPLDALLVCVYADPFGALAMVRPSNTGGAVTWGTSARASIASGQAAGIWLGQVTTSASMTVTHNPGGGDVGWIFGCVVVTGAWALASQAGATLTGSSASGTPSLTLASLVGANSLVLGVLGNNSNTTLPTVGPNQSTSFNGLTFAYQDTASSDNYSAWAQRDTRQSLAIGASDTINDTAPTGIAYAMAVVEILVAPPPPVFFPTTNVNQPMRARAR